MSGMSGIEVVRGLRGGAGCEQVPVVMYTWQGGARDQLTIAVDEERPGASAPGRAVNRGCALLRRAAAAWAASACCKQALKFDQDIGLRTTRGAEGE
jgi:hypothetical protein